MADAFTDIINRDLIHLFKNAAEAVNAIVFISAPEELADKLSTLCHDYDISALPCSLPADKTWDKLAACLSKSGITPLHDTARDIMERHNAGMTAAAFGTADTGTLVFFETSAAHVRPGTIPERHIVLLKASDIRRSASDISNEIDAFILEHISSGKPCRVSFVSGPSRTADIERTLTVGVHGPKMLTIFILDENPRMSGGVSV